MKNTWSLSAVFLFLSLAGVLGAQEPPPGAPTPPPPPPDEVQLKDGSFVIGEILNMTDGKLKVKTVFGGEIAIDWKEVKGIKTSKTLPFVLKDGTELRGSAQPGLEGSLDIRGEVLTQPSTVALGAITAINPPPKRLIIYKGNLSTGFSVSDGNTRTKSFSLLGEFEARSEKQRFTLRGSYNYAEDEDSVNAQNGKGFLKYDYFLTKRLYMFASALFEHDGIQDVNLRTALSAGPGWQVIDKGDYAPDWLKEMQLYVEAGVSYFNEDFDNAEDQTYVSGRWAIKFDWPFVPQRITFFHYHEGYPGFERSEDLYISTETGLRFSIWKNFVATAQVNWRWDNTPSPGFLRSDTLYLVTLGYSFEI